MGNSCNDTFRKRIGNDLHFEWTIDTDDKPVSLEGRDLKVSIIHTATNYAIYPKFTVSGNKLYFTFYGREQSDVGLYALLLVENQCKKDMRTLDHLRVIQLVAHTEQEGGSCCPCLSVETVKLSDNLSMCGTFDYEGLINLPKINGVTLIGDKKSVELNLLSGIRVEGEIVPPDENGIVDLTGGGGGGIPEAPADGKLYGRQDKTWKEVKAEGCDIPLSVVDGKLCITFEKQ